MKVTYVVVSSEHGVQSFSGIGPYHREDDEMWDELQVACSRAKLTNVTVIRVNAED